MFRMEMLERNVAHPNSLVLFPLANESHTLCNVANKRSLNLDGLGSKRCQHPCMRVWSNMYLCCIDECCIPLSRTCPNKSSTSE